MSRRSVLSIVIVLLLAGTRLYFRWQNSPARQSEREVETIADGFRSFGMEKRDTATPSPDFGIVVGILADPCEIAVRGEDGSFSKKTVSRKAAAEWLEDVWDNARTLSVSVQDATSSMAGQDMAVIDISADVAYSPASRTGKAKTLPPFRHLALSLRRNAATGWFVHAVIAMP